MTQTGGMAMRTCDAVRAPAIAWHCGSCAAGAVVTFARYHLWHWLLLIAVVILENEGSCVPVDSLALTGWREAEGCRPAVSIACPLLTLGAVAGALLMSLRLSAVRQRFDGIAAVSFTWRWAAEETFTGKEEPKSALVGDGCLRLNDAGKLTADQAQVEQPTCACTAL